MGRYDYDDMPSSERGKRGGGSRRTALISLICILVLLIGIVIYLIAVPAEQPANEPANSSVTVEVSAEVEPVVEVEEAKAESVVVEEPVIEEVVDIEEVLETEVVLPEEPVEEEVLLEEPVVEEPIVEENIEEVLEAVSEEHLEAQTPVEELVEEIAEEIPEEAIEVEPELVELAPPVPVISSEDVQMGFLAVLGKMNMDPIVVEEPTVVIEEAVAEPEVLKVETPFEEEAEEKQVEVFVLLSGEDLVKNGVVENNEYELFVRGKAGQGVTSPVEGTVTFVGKNGDKAIEIQTSENLVYTLSGFERILVKKGQSISSGTVVGSLGKSSSMPLTLSVKVTDLDGNPIEIK